jgi:asparagine synthase (glutamine-hydrolysing)
VPYIARKTVSFGVKAFSRRRSIARLAQYLNAENAAAIYQAQMVQRHNAYELVMISEDLSRESETGTDFPGNALYSTMMYMDTMTYLPDDILVKVDRASMAVGLETRVPMLDHRVVEFAWQLSLRMKVRGHTAKWLLKQVLGKYLVNSLPDRPKMGFGVPVGEWLRGPLREWSETLLGEDRLRRDGYLRADLAREQWRLHLEGKSNSGERVWHMLAFQAWLESVA